MDKGAMAEAVDSSSVSSSSSSSSPATLSTGPSHVTEVAYLLRDVSEEDSEDDEEDGVSGGSLIGKWLEGDSLAPPCQADMHVVDAILAFAQLSGESKLIDLGCGDGRISIRASLQSKCQAWGCEIEENLVQKFRRNIAALNLSDRVFCIQGDLCDIDYSKYNVIVIYLLPEAIELIKQKLRDAVSEGAVLICNTWGPKGWSPVERTNCGRYKNVPLIKYDKRSLPSPV